MTVEGISMMVTPRPPSSLHNGVWKFRSEPQLVNFMRECVAALDWAVEVVLQIVHMHVPIAETLARRKMEVTDDLVYSYPTFDSTALAALGVEVFAVVLALALVYVLAATERPGDPGVCVADFVTGVAAAGLLGCRRSWGAVAPATIFRVEMGCVLVRMSLSPLAFTFFFSLLPPDSSCVWWPTTAKIKGDVPLTDPDLLPLTLFLLPSRPIA